MNHIKFMKNNHNKKLNLNKSLLKNQYNSKYIHLLENVNLDNFLIFKK